MTEMIIYIFVYWFHTLSVLPCQCPAVLSISVGQGKDGVFFTRQGEGKIQIFRVGVFPGGEQENKPINF